MDKLCVFWGGQEGLVPNADGRGIERINNKLGSWSIEIATIAVAFEGVSSPCQIRNRMKTNEEYSKEDRRQLSTC